MMGVSLFGLLLLALVSLVSANDAWQLEKLALDVAERIRGAQRADRDQFISVGKNQCADVVLSTMRDVAESEAIADLMNARIARQKFSAEWLGHDLKLISKVAENIVNYNDDVRSKAWAELKQLREAQRNEFKQRTLAIGRAMSVVRQLTGYFSAGDVAGASAAVAEAAFARAGASALAAKLPSTLDAAAASLPVQTGPGGMGVVAALPAGTGAEDERFYSAFLETETEITASTEVDLGVGKQATATELAAAVANVTRVHLYDRDRSVTGLFHVLHRFLDNGFINSRVGYNPYTLRMLHSIGSELSAHQHGVLSFERLATTNYGHFDRYFALAARRPLTMVDVTPLQEAVIRAQRRVTLVQHGLRENLLVQKDMAGIVKQYKRALLQVRDDCSDANSEYKRRSMIRKKALDLVETLIYPHVGAFGDLLGAGEAEEIVRALAKIDPMLHLNGAWSAWRFTECDAPCGLGRQTLFRECNSPAPRNGGSGCAGRTKIRNYPCNVGLCQHAPPAVGAVAVAVNGTAAPAAPAHCARMHLVPIVVPSNPHPVRVLPGCPVLVPIVPCDHNCAPRGNGTVEMPDELREWLHNHPGAEPPMPGANDTKVPVPPYPVNPNGVRPGFAPGALEIQHEGRSHAEYRPAAVNPTSMTFNETAKVAFVPLPQITTGVTPITRGSFPSLSSNGDALMVADNDGNVYTYGETTDGLWAQTVLPLQRFQVGFGQSSVLSPDGNSGVICSKWRCALYTRTSQPKPLPLPTLNNTNPTVPAGVDYVWNKTANFNAKVVRYARPAASHDMHNVLIADRCQMHQFQRNAAGEQYSTLESLSVSQYDCRSMGWGINTAASLAAISGDGKTRVFVGSCARRAFCNDNNRFSIVYVFVDGKRVSRTVVPSATISSAAVSVTGDDIVLGAPLDRAAFHLVRLIDGTYDYAYVDPTFESAQELNNFKAIYHTDERVKREKDVERASVETHRTPAATIKSATAQAGAEVPGVPRNATAANATAPAAGKALVETATEAHESSDADEDADADADSEEEADEESESEAEAEASFVELEAQFAASPEAELTRALEMEHEEDMQVQDELEKQSLLAALPSASAPAGSLLESGATHAVAARIAKIQALKRAGTQTLARMKAQSQIEASKTIDIPIPHERSVELFFGNRVAMSDDGLWMAVQALRNGRVSIEVYRRWINAQNIPEHKFNIYQKILVPWSTPTDFDGGLHMGGNATTITIGSIRGAVAVIARPRYTEKFAVPEMKW